MKKLKRKQENIKLELKLEETNLQNKIQKLSEKEINLEKRVLRKFFSCKYKVVLYISGFYLPLVILKMAYEAKGTLCGKNAIRCETSR